MGNGTCDLSFIHIRETADLQPIGTDRNPDFDLYIKKVDCKLNIPRDPNESATYSSLPLRPVDGLHPQPDSYHNLFGQDLYDPQKYSPHKPEVRPNGYSNGPEKPIPKPGRPDIRPQHGSEHRPEHRPEHIPDYVGHNFKRPDLDPYPNRRPYPDSQDPYILPQQEGPNHLPPPPEYEKYAPDFLPPPRKPTELGRPKHGPMYLPELNRRPENQFRPHDDFLDIRYGTYPYRTYYNLPRNPSNVRHSNSPLHYNLETDDYYDNRPLYLSHIELDRYANAVPNLKSEYPPRPSNIPQKLGQPHYVRLNDFSSYQPNFTSDFHQPVYAHKPTYMVALSDNKKGSGAGAAMYNPSAESTRPITNVAPNWDRKDTNMKDDDKKGTVSMKPEMGMKGNETNMDEKVDGKKG